MTDKILIVLHNVRLPILAVGVWLIATAEGFGAISEPREAYNLVKDGVAVSRVVLAKGAGKAERHAAEELAAYHKKISGASLEIGSDPVADQYSVYLGTVDSRDIPLSTPMKVMLAAVGNEGYLLAIDRAGVRIVGRKPVGVLYGVYNLLKKYGDVRWFAPGEEFEYCPKTPTVTVLPEIAVVNPSFEERRLWFTGANVDQKLQASWDWMLHNGMQPRIMYGANYQYQKDFFEKRGIMGAGGAIQFDALINPKDSPVKPEYFPLVDGKRLNSMTGVNQPCTSNPEVIKIMSDNLIDKILSYPTESLVILNNDGQTWCQCRDCVALDPPEEREKRIVSTRYWTLINALSRAAREKYPDVRIIGAPYQNFQVPPVSLPVDRETGVKVCVHHKCYRHAFEDTNCLANAKWRDILPKWGGLNPHVSTFEYPDCLPQGDVHYLPIERIFVKHLKYYRQLGMQGSMTFIPPPDGIYSSSWITDQNRRLLKEMWHGLWPFLYMQAVFLWNIDADYDAVFEDMGSKYYGMAWPAMKKYRLLLTRAFEESAGCMLYGTPNTALGKCLENDETRRQLPVLLDEAERLAASDPVLLKKIRMEKEYFNDSWMKMYAVYQAAKLPELKVKCRQQPIVIDGRLEEADWTNAAVVTDFVESDEKTVANPQTFGRLVYDPDNLYVGVEVMEPAMDKMKVMEKNRDGNVFGDSSIELFIQPPGGDGRYAHVVINPDGVLFDAMDASAVDVDKKFDAGVEVKTQKLAGRWIMEARVPAAAFKCRIKEGEAWKINIGRNRALIGQNYTQVKYSSWSHGLFHSPEAYRTATFGEK